MSDLDLMFLKLVKAYGVAGSAMLFALTGFGGGVWLVGSAWMTVQGQAGINETKIRLYEAEIERLRITAAERDAIYLAAARLRTAYVRDDGTAATLNSLLERLA
jgi:hypothetical protein